MKFAFVFPGQGSQSVGMLAAFAAADTLSPVNVAMNKSLLPRTAAPAGGNWPSEKEFITRRRPRGTSMDGRAEWPGWRQGFAPASSVAAIRAWMAGVRGVAGAARAAAMYSKSWCRVFSGSPPETSPKGEFWSA